MLLRQQKPCYRCYKCIRSKHDGACSFSLRRCRIRPARREPASIFADHVEPRGPFNNRFGIAGHGLNGQRVALPDWSATWVGVGATHNAGSLDGQPCEAVPARAVIVSGQVESFLPVELVFAWTQSEQVPVILGQVNFFMEFDVCFFGSQSAFEVKPKST